MNDRSPTLGPVSVTDERAASRFSPRTVQIVALVGVASSSFPITVLSAALPDIADDLDSSVSTITWVIAAPLLAFAAFTPMAGKLGDLYGHRRIYLLGFAGAAVMSLATATAWNAASLIVFRVIGQAMSASTGPSALALIMSVYPLEKRTSVAGNWSAVLAASPAVGVVIGGPIIDATSWRALFLIQGAGAALAVLLSWRVLPSTPRRRDLSFDLLGGLLLATAVGSLLVAVNRGAVTGWGNPVVVAGLIAAPLLMAGFVRWEQRTAHPLVALPTLRRRNVALPLLSQMLLNGPYMAGLVITSIMLAAVFDYSTTAIALLILPRPIAFAAGAWAADWLVTRLGGRRVVIAGGSMVALGLAFVGLGAWAETLPLVILGVLLAGSGSGIVRPPIIATLTAAVGDAEMGVGTGMLNMTGQIGAAAGISILSALVTESSSPERFLLVFLIAAGIGVAAIVPGAAMTFADDEPLAPPTPHPSSPYSTSIDSRRLKE